MLTVLKEGKSFRGSINNVKLIGKYLYERRLKVTSISSQQSKHICRKLRSP